MILLVPPTQLLACAKCGIEYEKLKNIESKLMGKSSSLLRERWILAFGAQLNFESQLWQIPILGLTANS